MMSIGKKIPAMENEEKIGVVSEGLMSDKAMEKIGVLTATIVYDEEKIGVASEGLMNDKAAEKIGVLKKDILEGRKVESYWDCKFIIAIELSSIWSE